MMTNAANLMASVCQFGVDTVYQLGGDLLPGNRSHSGRTCRTRPNGRNDEICDFIRARCWQVCRLPLVMALLAALIILPAYSQSDVAIPPEVAANAQDWPLPNHDYNSTRAATNSSINSSNVNSLGVAWAMPLTGTGSFGGAATTPLILGDKIYFQDLGSNVFCLDFSSGKVLWKRIYNVSLQGPNGPAVGSGKLFATTNNYNLAALNLSSGDEVWNTTLSTIDQLLVGIQPVAYDGMIYTATSPPYYQSGRIGYIYALDQETGRVWWAFSTVDSANLWGHPELNSGGGASYTPSIDTRTGITYWGTGNPGVFPGTKEWPNGASRPGPNLYTDCLIALDHRDGRMLWYTQVYPHDLFDWDFQLPPILAQANISGRQQDVIIGSGKMGKVFAFNRSTGAILWVVPVGKHQNDTLVELPAGTTTVYPDTLGGVETPMAYEGGVVYVTNTDLYGNYSPDVPFPGIQTQDFSQGRGGLTAIQVDTGKVLWTYHLEAMNFGAATVVNDLVFTATYDGIIYAFKRNDGSLAWKYRSPAGINGWPAVAGDTIIWPCGLGTKPVVIAFRLGAKGNLSTILAKSSNATAGNVTINATVAVNAAAKPKGVVPSNSIVTNATARPQNVAATGQMIQNATGKNVPKSQLQSTIPTNASTNSMNSAASGIMAANPSAGNISQAGLNSTSSSQVRSVTVNLTAKGIAFDKKTITVPAGAKITISFNNQDSGVPHNFAAYTDSSASSAIFVGQVISGPKKVTYTFTAPSKPGTYFFRCDVHPVQMTGQFIVQ